MLPPLENMYQDSHEQKLQKYLYDAQHLDHVESCFIGLMRTLQMDDNYDGVDLLAT